MKNFNHYFPNINGKQAKRGVPSSSLSTHIVSFPFVFFFHIKVHFILQLLFNHKNFLDVTLFNLLYGCTIINNKHDLARFQDKLLN